MTVTFNISVADALDWFGLDDTNVTEQKVKKVPSGTKQIVGAQSGDQFKVAIF
jgi:hypothetical protein